MNKTFAIVALAMFGLFGVATTAQAFTKCGPCQGTGRRSGWGWEGGTTCHACKGRGWHSGYNDPLGACSDD